MEISGMNVSLAGNYGTTYTSGQSNVSSSQNISETTEETTGGLTDKQLRAQRKEDLSKDSLTEQFEERHANDRKDWTSQLEDRIVELGLEPNASVTTGSSLADTAQATIDVSV